MAASSSVAMASISGNDQVRPLGLDQGAQGRGSVMAMTLAAMGDLHGRRVA